MGISAQRIFGRRLGHRGRPGPDLRINCRVRCQADRPQPGHLGRLAAGLGRRGEKSRISRASPHRPPLRVFSRRVGWQVEFGPCERGFGKYVENHQWRGEFIDALSLAYSLDAERGASYGEHRGLFGLSPADLPVAVEASADGAAAMAAAVESLHEFAVVLDDRSAMWFTSSADRKEGRGRVDLARTVSPGRIASDLLCRSGATAPLETFKLSEEESAHWCETFHGGRCEAHPGLSAPVRRVLGRRFILLPARCPSDRVVGPAHG